MTFWWDAHLKFTAKVLMRKRLWDNLTHLFHISNNILNNSNINEVEVMAPQQQQINYQNQWATLDTY